MLTAKQIEGNKKKFLEINQEHNIFTPELLEFLGEELFVSPASPSLDMYNCYPGGLIHHLFRVCKHSIEINELLPENIKLEKNKILKTVFLSQIGKVHLYKPNESEWHRVNLGKLYEYKDDELVAMNIGQRSIFYATKYGIKLEEDEFQAIIGVDSSDFKSLKWETEPLTHIIKLGFQLALLIAKNGTGKV